jgi:hypothetical protein
MSKYVDENYDQPSNQPVTYKQGNTNNNQVNASGKLSNVKYGPVTDPSSELEKCVGVLIKQIPEFFEAATGCETPNIYHVFGSSTSGFNFLFKCKEKSGWCMRHCCTSTRRGFDMDMSYIASGNPMDPIATDYATAYKSCNLACCCLCRPELIVTLKEGEQPIGRVKYVCTLCNPTFHAYDKNDNLRYIVSASCCQCSLMCSNNFCGKFSECLFEIYGPDGSGAIGKILKQSASPSEMVTDADSYEVNFPNNASWEDKLLLTALGLLIDYQYFEIDNKDDKTKKEKQANVAKMAMS